MDRFKLAACGLAAAIALTGCGAGQISQTATQQAAVNGSWADVGQIAVRNIFVRATLTSDFVEPGDEVELVFQAVNGSPDTADKLKSITSDVGTVTLTGDTTVPPAGSLFVGTPDNQPELAALKQVQTFKTAKATIELTEPITNGLNYPFTFTFEKAGEVSVEVPLSAGEQPRREPGSDTGGYSGGH